MMKLKNAYVNKPFVYGSEIIDITNPETFDRTKEISKALLTNIDNIADISLHFDPVMSVELYSLINQTELPANFEDYNKIWKRLKNTDQVSKKYAYVHSNVDIKNSDDVETIENGIINFDIFMNLMKEYGWEIKDEENKIVTMNYIIGNEFSRDPKIGYIRQNLNYNIESGKVR